MEFNLSGIHRAAIEIAKRGGDHTLTFYKQDIEVQQKEDESPVTAADRETETLMRRLIKKQFPEHGIIGEEHGEYQPEAEIQWIIDPIDGTKSFIHGVPLYTTLIGILYKNEPVAGVIYAPVLNELCEAAKGHGARINGKSCKVRSCKSLQHATLLTTDVTTAASVNLYDPLQSLIKKSRLHRTWGDAYGHLMVATGRADIMFDPELNLWDAAALLPVLQESGGIFCDINGNETIDSGNGISCSRSLIKEVLEQFG